MRRVFISYSHDDIEALEQLSRFLVPLERSGQLTCWDDRKISAGDDWEGRIDEALGDAGIAVLLVTQDFLASEFIAHRELPHLLDRHAKGQTILLPVFLAPSNVSAAQPELAKLQGDGEPETTRTLAPDEREILFKKLSVRLLELAGGDTPVLPTRGRPSPTPAISPATSSAHELTVSLRQEGAALVTAYSQPGRETFLTTPRPLEAVTKAIAPICRALDAGDVESVRDHIRTARGHWGRILFEVLFGSDASTHGQIFRAAFHQPPPAAVPTAVHGSLRLRIATEDPALLGLPWRLASWEDRLLVNEGWVFLPCLAADVSRDLVTAAPSEVLLVAPQDPSPGPAGEARHLEVLEQTLKDIWPGREVSVRRARTVDQLRNALAGQQPHLVYAFAALETRRGQTCLLLDDPAGTAREALPLGDLVRMLGDSPRPPAVLYLNAHGTVIENPPRVFAAGPPLVVWRRLPAQSDDAPDMAIAWLGTWLRQGLDPVEALHRVSGAERFAAAPGAQTLSVLTNYRHWRTDRMTAVAARERLAHLRLDREKQKGVVGKWVGELAASDTLRVMAVVPFAAPGNRLADVQDQFCHYLELALSDRVAVKPVRMEFPKTRGALRKDLEWELSLQLEADDGEPVRDLLQRWAPRASGRHRPLLWLHWGMFGSGADCQAPLGSEELAQWLNFAGTFIPQHCPANLRIVCSLAIETPPDKHPLLNQLLNAKHRELDDPRFWLRILEPIGNVAENELFDYFKDEQNGCPPAIRSELAQRLIDETGGAFETLVERIQQAESSSFHGLLETLRREQDPATPDSGVTF